ncbi:aspartyl protease APCB1 [Cryptomeria japonica]|uniref:aspartyl protease APCB1 n=1 Tax=Cryptomeria japonica TaxID=3369 RepID=UPI0027DA2DD0|nr:aspartyl protease APCB1 [Cryptomeria japonica]
MLGNMKVDVEVKLLCLLAFGLTILSGCIPASIGTAGVYPIYPKNEQSEVSSLVEQDTQRIGRRLQATAKTAFFNVQGNVYPDGIYYVNLSIGNPQNQYYLDVDTGSDLTWLQCDAPCQSCAKTPHQWYKPKPRSGVSCKDPLCAAVQATSHDKYDCQSSYQQCDYDIRYADNGFSKGVLVRDCVAVTLSNGTIVRPTYVFGCGYIQGGSLRQTQTTDGVLGLSSAAASLPSQWEKQGLIKNVIGICITGGGKKGGYMFFGDELVPTSSMTWVPLFGRPPIMRENTHTMIRLIVHLCTCYPFMKCSLRQTQTTDGVLGLSSAAASLPSQWEKQGLIKNVIGICITGGGKKGGYMFFGDELVPTSSMTWVPLFGRPPMRYYHVGAAQMIFGNKLLAKDGDERRLGGIIFDTGSSYTYFTKQAHDALVSAVKESIGKQLVQDSLDQTLPFCWKGKKKLRSIADVKSYFKPLKFNFKSNSRFTKNANFEIPPEGYLVISVKGNVCLGILDGTEVSSYNVIGDISLQGYLVVHDNGNNRIGWTRMECTKLPKSGQRRWALEDTQQLPEGEAIPFAQDLGKGVCPATSYFIPDFGTLQ